MLRYVLDSRGNAVPCDDAELFERFLCDTEGRRVVALTEVGEDVAVSTVFLGIDHSFGTSEEPILWETLVFGGRLDGEMARYSSRLEAEEGHEKMVLRVRAEQLT